MSTVACCKWGIFLSAFSLARSTLFCAAVRCDVARGCFPSVYGLSQRAAVCDSEGKVEAEARKAQEGKKAKKDG